MQRTVVLQARMKLEINELVVNSNKDLIQLAVLVDQILDYNECTSPLQHPHSLRHYS